MAEPTPGVRRVGLVFSGGPAPAANAVIGAAATALRRKGAQAVAILHGYAGLQGWDEAHPLVPEVHYHVIEDRDLWGLRNTRGVFVGTGRANPGKGVTSAADLDDPAKTARLRRVVDGLVALGIDGLVSIGGDDTLRTANLLHRIQARARAASAPFVRIVHVPKTIDNDYEGIDFTFGFFTAVGTMATELLNLRADARATSSYFVVETMGRKAGWLAYGVAIAGEAHLVIGVEDVVGPLAASETVRDAETGETRTETRLSLGALADRVVDLILAREQRGKPYGTVVLAEGLAEMLPEEVLRDVARDEHGHVSLGRIDIGKVVAKVAAERYEARTGRAKKITGVQLGYESRCSPPHAFDVMLGSQLGVGAARALCDLGLDGHMVSVSGQLDLRYVPFADLVDPETLRTEVRFIRPGSDFHRLARELGTRVPPR